MVAAYTASTSTEHQLLSRMSGTLFDLKCTNSLSPQNSETGSIFYIHALLYTMNTTIYRRWSDKKHLSEVSDTLQGDHIQKIAKFMQNCRCGSQVSVFCFVYLCSFEASILSGNRDQTSHRGRDVLHLSMSSKPVATSIHRAMTSSGVLWQIQCVPASVRSFCRVLCDWNTLESPAVA